MKFTKMEGLGNDYIYLNCTMEVPPNLPDLAQRLSHRHLGVGADGLICIRRGTQGDFCMEMYNADGSRGEMCGNGIRCLGKYVYDRGLTRKMELSIETSAGLRQLWLHIGETTEVDSVTVDMGAPIVEDVVALCVNEHIFHGTPVSMGNPHIIIPWNDLATAPVQSVGPLLEVHPQFPNRTNVSFMSVADVNNIHLREWERGSGETLACGTGACACFAAARAMGRCHDAVTVHLPGGALKLIWQVETGHILMTGPAHTVFDGTLPALS